MNGEKVMILKEIVIVALILGSDVGYHNWGFVDLLISSGKCWGRIVEETAMTSFNILPALLFMTIFPPDVI
jgi:hypothetical protein